MAISVLNTDAGLSGKTIQNLEDAQTVTGLKTFDRDPNAPFAVSASSAVVTNLDADKLDGLEAAAFLKADGSTALTAGLQFPATQNASSNANTLDDYEEGTWTPTIVPAAGSGITYSAQDGVYIKVGQLVNCWGRITITGLGTASGAISFGGLPFSAHATGVSHFAGGAISFFSNCNWTASNLSCYVIANTTTAPISAGGTTSHGQQTIAQLTATTDLIFHIVYRASA